MRRKKGFTLVELVVVTAIIAALVAISVPAYTGIRRSRMRAQNNKAKAVFNAAQTIITELEFTERKYMPFMSSSQADKAAAHIYTPVSMSPYSESGTDWCYYWDGHTGYRCSLTGTRIDYSSWGSRATVMDEWNEQISSYINRIVKDEIVYKIYIDDYKVQSVVVGSSENDRWIGAHPVTLSQLKADNVNIEPLQNAHARAVNPKFFDLDATNDT